VGLHSSTSSPLPKSTPSEPAATLLLPLTPSGFLHPGRAIWVQGCPVPMSSPPAVAFCSLLASLQGRGRALGQGPCSKVREGELEGATDAGLPRRDRGCGLPLRFAGTGGEKQRVAALFPVLRSHGLVRNLL